VSKSGPRPSDDALSAERFRLGLAASRDDALRSLDERFIRSVMARFNVSLPGDSDGFWLAVHRARVNNTSLSREAREVSRTWLESRS
jgi:hypothetical protein